MRKVKRFLTALLCVCLLAGVMAPAASAVTVLTIINLTVDAPAVGKKPEETTASVPDHAHSVVKELEWSGDFASDGTFKAGEKYTATVTMGIKSGEDWKFSDKVTMSVKVNEKAANKIWYINDKELQVVYTFPKLASSGSSSSSNSSPSSSANVLTSAAITLNAPNIGSVPAATAKVPSDAAYTVKSVEWSGSLRDGKFKENTSYTAYITLGIKSGKNAVFSDETFDAVVNVFYLIDEIRWVSPTEIIVPVEFDKTASSPPSSSSEAKPVSIIRLTIDEPAAGKTPAAAASVPSSAHTVVQDVKWSGQLDTNGTFMPRVKYTVTITMGIKPGINYYFSDKANSITATVNDKDADEVYWYASDRVEVVYTFPEFGTGTIPNQADITPDAPAVGEKPAAPAASNNTLTAVGNTATKFTDVPASSPFAAAINWAVEKGITSGKTTTTFEPGEQCTQAQILTFLWRGSGFPEPKGTVAMEGFTGSEYYYKAAQWAAEQNMVSGEFDPGAPCTRSMAMTYMWKQAGSPSAAAASFTDVPAGADYAQAVAWAVSKGVTTGVTNTTFAPENPCTRGQIMTFLYRAFK